MSAGSDFLVRLATADDAALIARHRAAMFLEMGDLHASRVADLEDRSTRYLEVALASGEYVGWLASPASVPDSIVSGAGVQVRRTLPHPREPDGTPHGNQAIVLNVYTEPGWRGRGAATLLMERVIRWAGDAGMHTLVLHASTAARPLYERVGFSDTNEMRYDGTLGAMPGPAAARQRT